MRALFVLLSLLAVACAGADWPRSLPQLSVQSEVGCEVYTNVVVTSVTATHIYFTHSCGLGSVKLKSLSPELQSRFHYDSVRAQAAQVRQDQANWLYAQHLRELAGQAALRRQQHRWDEAEEDSAATTQTDCAVSPNPAPMSADSALALASFAAHPLFGPGGPSKDDVFEGTVGDCYFLAIAAAIADSHPDFIRRTVVKLQDGTFLVRFFRRDGTPSYVRVDAELWVNSAGQPQYARLGRRGCIWVPILEKAFAVCRRNPAGYDSINGSGGLEVNRLVGKYGNFSIDAAGIDEAEFMRWFENGAAESSVKTTIWSQTRQFLSRIDGLRQNGQGVILGGPINFTDELPLEAASAGPEKSTYHRAQHLYMVDHVEKDAEGACSTMVLRDPWGLYRRIADPARLFFCMAGAASIELPE